jgi:hypothetical protein
MFTDVQHELWEVYLRVEGRGPRVDKLRALSSFLDCLTESREQEGFPWARSIAESVIDKGDSFIIRMPLFERAIFPALLAGYRAGLPGCARWLAGLFGLLCRSARCRKELSDAERTEVGLLRAALRHDPTDQFSRRRLLEQLAGRLRYAVHEVPSGVLYGIDGASAEQCLELAKELDEFCMLASEEENEDSYGELIRKCRFHFRAYRDFLLSPGDCRSYAEYLCQTARQRPD